MNYKKLKNDQAGTITINGVTENFIYNELPKGLLTISYNVQ